MAMNDQVLDLDTAVNFLKGYIPDRGNLLLLRAEQRSQKPFPIWARRAISSPTTTRMVGILVSLIQCSGTATTNKELGRCSKPGRRSAAPEVTRTLGASAMIRFDDG